MTTKIVPLYEYVCQVCGQRFERRQRFGDPPVEICPAGHKAVRRLISRPSIHFRGSGFYVTDSKKASHTQSD